MKTKKTEIKNIMITVALISFLAVLIMVGIRIIVTACRNDDNIYEVIEKQVSYIEDDRLSAYAENKNIPSEQTMAKNEASSDNKYVLRDEAKTSVADTDEGKKDITDIEMGAADRTRLNSLIDEIMEGTK